MTWPPHYPVLGICGHSGAGKTTLIEQLVPRLLARSLRLAVIKHDAHGLTLDQAGKDTDRFFRTGATVFGHDPDQVFLRRPLAAADPLGEAIAQLLPDHDLIIVEGHKQTPLPAKIWLHGADGEEFPTDYDGPWVLRLSLAADRPQVVENWLADWLPARQQRQPLRGGLLVGGSSQRMGRPKQMLVHRGRSWAEWVAEAMLAHVAGICFLGGGPLPPTLQSWPQLPDAPGLAGPAAGMVAAMRWDPGATWLFLPCDMPLMTADALGWLLAQRRPGCWAVLPRHAGSARIEPLGAWYDPRLGRALVACLGPRELAGHGKVETPAIPAVHAAAWRSFNTQAVAAELT